MSLSHSMWSLTYENETDDHHIHTKSILAQSHIDWYLYILTGITWPCTIYILVKSTPKSIKDGVIVVWSPLIEKDLNLWTLQMQICTQIVYLHTYLNVIFTESGVGQWTRLYFSDCEYENKWTSWRLNCLLRMISTLTYTYVIPNVQYKK